MKQVAKKKAKGVAGVYLRTFITQGFVTFTTLNKEVEEFVALAEQRGFKTEVKQHSCFVTVSKTGKRNTARKC